MAGYALDNSWERARHRLSLLEQYLDPMTKRRLTMLGIRHGLRCLEVGAGGGSVAAWLCVSRLDQLAGSLRSILI